MSKSAHDVFGNASRKAWQAPQRLSPQQERELMEIAARGDEIDDEEESWDEK